MTGKPTRTKEEKARIGAAHNHNSPDEFEERIAIDREFKEKWLKKQIGRYKHVELLE